MCYHNLELLAFRGHVPCIICIASGGWDNMQKTNINIFEITYMSSKITSCSLTQFLQPNEFWNHLMKIFGFQICLDFRVVDKGL